MTADDRLAILAWLKARLERARAHYEAAKKIRPGLIFFAADAPEPDGTLLRIQARAGAELTAYAAALRDHTALAIHGQISGELLREWQAANRKPMTTAHPESSER